MQQRGRGLSAGSEASAGRKPGGRGEEDSEDEPEQLQCKVILLGDGAIGKTSIAMRFTEDYFAKQYKQTIGVDFFIKRLVLPGDVTLCPPASKHLPLRLIASHRP